MDAAVLQEVLDELFPALEELETQNAAILQFLKDRGIASDHDLAPFLEKAASASSVRWRAARIRMDHQLSGAAKATEIAQEKSRQAIEANKNQEETQKPAEAQPNPEEKTAADPKAAADGASARQREESKQTADGKPALQAKQ